MNCFLVSLFVEILITSSSLSIMLALLQAVRFFRAVRCFIVCVGAPLMHDLIETSVGLDVIEEARDLNLDLGRDDNR